MATESTSIRVAAGSHGVTGKGVADDSHDVGALSRAIW